MFKEIIILQIIGNLRFKTFLKRLIIILLKGKYGNIACFNKHQTTLFKNNAHNFCYTEELPFVFYIIDKIIKQYRRYVRFASQTTL